MADDKDRAIKDHAVLTSQVTNHGIVRPKVQADNFELKPMIFQILQKWGNSMDNHKKILTFT